MLIYLFTDSSFIWIKYINKVTYENEMRNVDKL